MHNAAQQTKPNDVQVTAKGRKHPLTLSVSIRQCRPHLFDLDQATCLSVSERSIEIFLIGCIIGVFTIHCGPIVRPTVFQSLPRPMFGPERFARMAAAVNAEAPAVIAVFQQMRQSHFIN